MKAKLVKPGKFHNCKECDSKNLAGEPTMLDGWVDNEKDFIGTIIEYPTREDAENACNPEYHPIERLQVWQCANYCRIKLDEKDAKLKVFEIWQCGECSSKYYEKDQAGNCCT